jgi:hypothetical protein
MDAPPASSVVSVEMLGPIARLAAAASRPFATLDGASLGFGPLSPTDMRALADAPAFSRPIERAVLARSDAVGRDLTREEAVSLATTGKGRLAILLVGAPFARLEEAALVCAAAVMQRQVLSAAGKQDRQRLRSAFGAEAYEVATREAPMLYGALSALGDARRLDEATAADDADGAHRRLVEFGLAVLRQVVAAAAPCLEAMMAARLPIGARTLEVGEVDETALRQFIKLIHRRFPQWSATIA